MATAIPYGTKPAHMWTRSQRLFPLLNPAPADIDPYDLAEHLAKANRYAGATDQPFSVAQHCVLVADLMPPDEQPYGLLHDAPEAYTGDLTKPLKEAVALVSQEAFQVLHGIDAAIERAVFQRFGLTWPMPAEIKARVKHADLVALATEQRDLFAEPLVQSGLPSPLARRIQPWPWFKAASAFHLRLRALGLIT